MLAVLGCLAQNRNYDIWNQGNPHEFYFLGMYTADESSTVWCSMEGYEMLFDDYILMKYANRVGAGIGDDAYLTVERVFDLSRYKSIEVVVENAGSDSFSVTIGSVLGAEIGVEWTGMTVFGGTTNVLPGATSTVTADISEITDTVQPAIHIHTTSNRQPNAKILFWRLVK